MSLSTSAKAEALLAAGRVAEALLIAEMGLSAGPGDPRLQSLRGRALTAIAAMGPAFAALQLDAAINGEKPAPHVELGHAYAERGQWSDAERCFRRGLALDPQSVEAQASLGFVYLNVGMTEARVWLATT